MESLDQSNISRPSIPKYIVYDGSVFGGNAFVGGQIPNIVVDNCEIIHLVYVKLCPVTDANINLDKKIELGLESVSELLKKYNPK